MKNLKEKILNKLKELKKERDYYSCHISVSKRYIINKQIRLLEEILGINTGVV